jgi:Leucine-rich repeat (LRR) protein
MRSLPLFPELLDVRNNPLYGEIPVDMGNMAALRKLEYVSRHGDKLVKLTHYLFILQLKCTWMAVFLEEAFPRAWATLPNLVSRAERNNVFSTIIFCLMLCILIVILDVSNNLLTGEVPASFANLKMLTDFTLSNNDITGAIPELMCTIDGLEVLVPDCAVTCTCCSGCV